MSFAIPVDRLRDTDTLVAFHHPRPSHRFHVLIVPKRSIAHIAAVTPADADFMADLVETVRSLVAEFKLDQTAYSLLTNGGGFQDVPILHFHLIADDLA